MKSTISVITHLYILVELIWNNLYLPTSKQFETYACWKAELWFLLNGNTTFNGSAYGYFHKIICLNSTLPTHVPIIVSVSETFEKQTKTFRQVYRMYVIN